MITIKTNNKIQPQHENNLEQSYAYKIRAVLFSHSFTFLNVFVDSIYSLEKHIITGIWYKMAGVRQRNLIDTAKPQEKGKRVSTMTKVANNIIDSGEMLLLRADKALFEQITFENWKKDCKFQGGLKFPRRKPVIASTFQKRRVFNSCRLLFSYFTRSERWITFSGPMWIDLINLRCRVGYWKIFPSSKV